MTAKSVLLRPQGLRPRARAPTCLPLATPLALPANNSKRNQPKIDQIKTGNQEIFDNRVIAENFNQYFVTVGKKLADKKPVTDTIDFFNLKLI